VKRGSRLQAAATALIILWLLLPFCWALVSSFAPERELFETARFFPSRLTLAHYRDLFTERSFWRPIENSLIVAAATSLYSVIAGAFCAYALTRMAFRGKWILLGLVLLVSMFPQIAIVSPLYLLLRALGLINTYPGLILPYLTFAMPLAVWLLVGYFQQLPWELEEAAEIDGAGRWRILREIVAPLAAPGLVTTAILTFIYCWNEFLFALSFTLGPEMHTVPVAIALFRGQYQVPWGEVLAASVVATAPLALVVLVLQRRIVQGLTSGAVKG
jgi:ABC-type glycerol-3-phosphate transport system permease component